jgi:acetyl-CoA carboxylase biotin carboxylase subunit
VVHFFERDCSVQRRHQTLIEESPSPVLKPAIRRRLGEAAVKGASRIDYRGLGTMEFLLDDAGHFYFMEMNTRLQVEHCVTEMVTGEDLVKLQIRLAAGEPLPVKQSEVVQRGHAIECRINAEDPRLGFRPSPGTASFFYPPGGPGVRMDTHVYAGYAIPPHYDSLIGKLITHGRSREEAIARMRRALDELVVEGVATTVPFHRAVMDDPAFLAGEYDTGLAEGVVARLVEDAKREAATSESGPAA